MRLACLLLLLSLPGLAEQCVIEEMQALISKPYYQGYEAEIYRPYKECSPTVKQAMLEQERDLQWAEECFANLQADLSVVAPDERVRAELAWAKAVIYLLRQNMQEVRYYHLLDSTFDVDRAPGNMDAVLKRLPELKRRYLEAGQP